MVRIIFRKEEIQSSEAVARKILKADEARFVSSVTAVGMGGYGSVFKLSLKVSFTDQGGSHWKRSTLGRNALARKIIEISRPEDEVDYRKEVENMQILCNKSHRNIIQYIGDGSIVPGSSYYIDMELCDIDLSQYMNGNNVAGVHGLPPWNKDDPDIFMIVAIMQQLLSGLSFMHKENKVHRDLDPTNILYSATDGWWKLADLGLTSNGTEGNKISEAGRGKPSYRPPELTSGDEKTYSKKTDTWSLGCIFYDLCVGKRAFHNDVAAFEHAMKKERLEIKFPLSLRRNVAQIILEPWIREMLDWDPSRRPTPEELGREFWKVLYALVSPSEFASMETIRTSADILSPENLLSTDVPTANQWMMKETPPRWEHILFQGACHSHNLKTLTRAKQVVVARETLLGESHPLTAHSRVRLAWMSFYMGPSVAANSSDEFKKLLELKAPPEHTDPDVVSYLAGLGWSERAAGNYDESSQNFEKALEIQYQCDRSMEPDTLAYTVALAEVHLAQALCHLNKTGRKRKRSTVDDLASARSLAENALLQMNLIYNCQCLNPKLGKDHPDAVETIKLLAWGHQVLATIKKAEPSSAKVAKQYHAASAELYLNEALELGRRSLGNDHPYTLYTLNEVGHLELKKGRVAEAISRLEEAFVKQKYVLGIDDLDTQATIANLQDAYRLSKDVRKSRDLMNEAGNKPLRVSRRSLRMHDIENGTDNEGDANLPSSQISQQ